MCKKEKEKEPYCESDLMGIAYLIEKWKAIKKEWPLRKMSKVNSSLSSIVYIAGRMCQIGKWHGIPVA